MNNLRELPSVDELLNSRSTAELVAAYGRSLTLEAIRASLAEVRRDYEQGQTIPLRPAILQEARRKLQEWLQPTLVPVINATGVVLHTNLGRAPLSKAALLAVSAQAGGYCTLEYDLPKGTRGLRSVHAEDLLKRLTYAEAALVVNNNAAGVMLSLAALANNKRVVISRSQLVEIGGGFRVPDVMRQSGARLVEVGTTNRTHLQDYEDALQAPAGMVLRAHHSNFKIIGFTSEPDLTDLAALARRYDALMMDDLGSGSLLDTAAFGLSHEPTVQESLAAGVDIVCFSGDKLLGGPQAGIILGRADLMARIRRHPLARVVRADKLCLAALTATLLHYLKDEVIREVPVWQMISSSPDQIKRRAEHWLETIGAGMVIPGFSTVGGGSLPGETLPTYLLALQTPQPNRFLSRLRGMRPPIIARVEEEKVLLDPRTVLPDQEGALLVGLQNALK